MKKASWIALITCGAFAALVACSSSSSSNGGGGGGAPSCKNPSSTGAGSAACNTCLQNNCSSQLSAVESSCQAYITCYEGCDCSDLSCLTTCVQTKVDSACQSTFQPQTTCLQQNCQTPCTTTVTVSDGGGGG